ncbi:response regulator [Magnetococcus sp. PR-3]|uniref:response regulator n=1 Tax=Magnetococcus sp. PR-3 TaxID=3120355 RepID=UPI002FCE68B9
MKRGRKGNVTLLFPLVGFLVLLLMTGYWLYELEPKLDANSESHARTLAGYQARVLADALQPVNGYYDPARLEGAIDEILIVKEPITGTPIVLGLRVEVDYDMVPAPGGSLDKEKGQVDCQRCFLTTVPLYDKMSGELLGIAEFYANTAFQRSLKGDVRFKLLLGTFFILIVLAWLWRMVWISIERERRSERSTRAIFEVAPFPMILVGMKDGRLRRSNRAAHQFFKVAEDLPISYPASALFVDPDVFKQIRQRLQAGESVRHEEFQVRDLEAHNSWSLVSAYALEDDAGDQLMVLGFAEITTLKQVQADLTQAKEEAEEATRAKSAFLANMSHEIRTPMNSVIGFSHLALKTKLDKQQQDYLTKILFSARSLLGLIGDILDFSKIEAGKLEIETLSFTLDEVLESVANLNANRAEEKGLELVLTHSNDVPQALIGDPLRLGQVLTNLVANAVKFTQKGSVEILVEPLEQDEASALIQFHVTDSGIGMTSEQAAQLFTPFTQVDISHTRRFGGTGLGLAICHNLVEMMGGKISVSSQPEVGSRFTFSARFGMQLAQNIKCDLSSALGSKKILLVESPCQARTALLRNLQGLKALVDVVPDRAALLARLNAAEEGEIGMVIYSWQQFEHGALEGGLPRLQTRLQLPPKQLLLAPAFKVAALQARAEQYGLDGVVSIACSPSVLGKNIGLLLAGKFEDTSLVPIRDALTQEGYPPKWLQGGKVLLVEDNPINQQVAQELLEQCGLDVSIANQGQEALDALQGRTFDLVLMDIQMPVMDGYEATKRIRQLPQGKQLPIIAMTAHAMSGDADRSLEAGMQGHLTKPIEIQPLYDMLGKWMHPNHPVEESVEADKGKVKSVKKMDGEGSQMWPPVSFPAGIDPGRVPSHLLKRPELFTKLLDQYLQLNEGLPERLREHWQQLGEDEDLHKQVHTLKGSALSIGASMVAQSCQNWEKSPDDLSFNLMIKSLQSLLDGIRKGKADI